MRATGIAHRASDVCSADTKWLSCTGGLSRIKGRWHCSDAKREPARLAYGGNLNLERDTEKG